MKIRRKDHKNLLICSICQAVAWHIQKAEVEYKTKSAAKRLEKQTDEVLTMYSLDKKEIDMLRFKLNSIWGALATMGVDKNPDVLMSMCLDLVEYLRRRKHHPAFDRMAGSLFTVIKHSGDYWIDPKNEITETAIDAADKVRLRL